MVQLSGGVGIHLHCGRDVGRVQKGVGIGAPLPWMNPVCLSNVLANTVDSKPAWADVLHCFLPKREVQLRGLLPWPLFG